MVSLIALSVWSLIQVADVSPPKVAKARPCKTWIARIAKVGIAAGIFAFAPAVIYKIDAAVEGRTHLGHGIFYNYKSILERTHPTILELLKLPPTTDNQAIIARYYTARLSGDYDKSDYAQILPTPREASSYLEGESHERGVCRHKALVLQAILNSAGIKAVIQIGYGKSWVPHMWVYLPELGLVADPTAGEVLPAEEFYNSFFTDGTRADSNTREILQFNDWTLTPFERGWFR